MPSLRAIVTVMLFFPVLPHVSAANDSLVIVAVSGTWTSNGNPVLVGTLQGDGKVTPPPQRRSSISFFSGDRLSTVRCNLTDCPNPVNLRHLNQTAAPGGILSVVSEKLGAVKETFSKDPTRYVSAFARGDGMEDAVALWDNGAVDLAPSFTGMEKGSYKVHLQAMGGNGEIAQTIAWDPATQSGAKVNGLKPGLYEARIVDDSGGMVGGSAWILARTGAKFAADKATFEQFVKTTDEWREDAPASAVEAIRRAELDLLSGDTQK